MNAEHVARTYFDLSNQRDLDQIETMFEERATYSSDSQDPSH